MYTKTSTLGMEHEEWLRLRKTGIGGSDAGAIAGVNPYSSAMKVFQDKTSEDIEETDSESMRLGKDLEEYVAQRFTEATGLKVRRSNMMYRSVEHPFMFADVDRLVVGEDAGLECKTASAYSADKWENGKYPLHYMFQCFHYMAVTGKKAWYLAVVILGKGFHYVKFEWDDWFIQELITLEKKFWYEHVVPRCMPDPDGSKVCDAVLEQYFHNTRKGSTVLLKGFDEKLKCREILEEQMKKLEAESKKIDQEIKLAMGENEYADTPGFHISWSNVETRRLDAKKMKEERPDLYDEFAVTTSSRRFTVKAA
ncbi:MAG: YqaJ viral recombinase family protein [Lachnospiraceae bacterium]|nr:YqaJ viral recombinase family protein [Lachnospiraceae bacterium]